MSTLSSTGMSHSSSPLPASTAGVSPFSRAESKAEKPEKIGRTALNCLARDPDNMPTGLSVDLKKSIQLLQTTEFVRTRSFKPFKLHLQTHEKALLHILFNDWGLSNQLCLFDVWGVDLFRYFEALQKLHPFSHTQVGILLSHFCQNYALSYVSLLAEHSASECADKVPKMSHYERGKPTSSISHLLTRNESIFCLRDLKDGLQKIKSAFKFSGAALACIEKIVQRVDLGAALLKNPDAPTFLCANTLNTLQAHFPKCPALNNHPPEKAFEDLLCYVKFIHLGFTENNRAGHLSINPLFLDQLHTQLCEFPKVDDKIGLLKKIKTTLACQFSEIGETLQNLKVSFERAKKGELTHIQFCKENSIVLRQKKSQEEFVGALYFKFLQASLLTGYAHDSLDILDGQVMYALYPKTFVPTYTAFKRVYINLSAFLISSAREFSSPPEPLPLFPCALSSEQAKQISAICQQVHQDMHSLLTEVSFTPEHLAALFHDFNQICDESRIFYHSWLPFLENFTPLVTHLNGQIFKLGELRGNILEQFEAFFETLDPGELKLHRIDWIDFCEEIFYRHALDFCQIAVLAKDIEAVQSLGSDLSVLNDEEHLLPSALIQFMTGEGLEELFDRLTYQPFYYLSSTWGPFLYDNPLFKALPLNPILAVSSLEGESKLVSELSKPLLPCIAKKSDPKDKYKGKSRTLKGESSSSSREANLAKPMLDPGELVETMEAMQCFKFRRGEKTRKLVQRLRVEGILPSPGKGRGTSHHEFGDGKQLKMSIPIGGEAHTEISRKVVRSLKRTLSKT